MKLDIQNLSKVCGKTPILKEIHLAIADKKSLIFLGPSGSGKSTLLRLIGGLIIPTKGTICLDDIEVPTEKNALLRYRRSIGMVFQAWNLFPHLTALQNVSLPLIEVHGYAPEQAREISLELLKQFELQNHADKRPGQLSGGQSQRIAILRAVAIKPRLLLFDEPTSALDPLMTAEVLDLIKGLKEQGTDFILVSHHLGFARKVADYTAFLSDGRLLEASPTAEFFAQPRTEEARAFLQNILKY